MSHLPWCDNKESICVKRVLLTSPEKASVRLLEMLSAHITFRQWIVEEKHHSLEEMEDIFS